MPKKLDKKKIEESRKLILELLGDSDDLVENHDGVNVREQKEIKKEQTEKDKVTKKDEEKSKAEDQAKDKISPKKKEAALKEKENKKEMDQEKKAAFKNVLEDLLDEEASVGEETPGSGTRQNIKNSRGGDEASKQREEEYLISSDAIEEQESSDEFNATDTKKALEGNQEEIVTTEKKEEGKILSAEAVKEKKKELEKELNIDGDETGNKKRKKSRTDSQKGVGGIDGPKLERKNDAKKQKEEKIKVEKLAKKENKLKEKELKKKKKEALRLKKQENKNNKKKELLKRKKEKLKEVIAKREQKKREKLNKKIKREKNRKKLKNLVVEHLRHRKESNLFKIPNLRSGKKVAPINRKTFVKRLKLGFQSLNVNLTIDIDPIYLFRNSFPIIIVTSLLSLLFYISIIVVFVVFEPKNSLSENISKYVLIPVIFTSEGVIDYKDYVRYERQLERVENVEKFRVELIKMIIRDDLYKKYKTTVPKVLRSSILNDYQVNIVAKSRIRKIKEIAERGSMSLAEVAKKYADSFGEISIYEAKISEYDFYLDIKDVGFGDVSKIIVFDEKYFIFSFKREKDNQLIYDYATVTPINLEEYIDYIAKDYQIWSLLK